jgi:hypothetical protein
VLSAHSARRGQRAVQDTGLHIGDQDRQLLDAHLDALPEVVRDHHRALGRGALGTHATFPQRVEITTSGHTLGLPGPIGLARARPGIVEASAHPDCPARQEEASVAP